MTVRNGGLPARRALLRWALRMFRREWRQQLVLIALLAVAVLVAVAGVAAAYNLAPRRNAVFGTANHRLVFDVSASDPNAIDDYLATIRDRFGTIDVIPSRDARVAGSNETVELRAQDPDGAFSAPMLAVRSGHLPRHAGEVAVTDDIAHSLHVGIGDRLPLDGAAPIVVGIVENPDDFGDDFALVAPASEGRPDALTILLDSNEDVSNRLQDVAQPGPGFIEARGTTEKGTAAAGALAASTVVLLLVCLIAASGFVVVAQRRLRQLGLLAATGATSRMLRLVVVANGAAVGVSAAIAGTLAGLATWVAVAPALETVANHRIGRIDIPWAFVGLAAALAVVAACAAAWWPARTMARVPVTRALSGRPPLPRRVHRSLLLSVCLLAFGVVSLMLGIDTTKDKANGALVIAGTLAIPLGVALLCPLAVRMLAPAARRLPVAGRLALRDLARYQARASAALAAISLALGISIAIVVAAAAAEDRSNEGNLSDRQVLVRSDAGLFAVTADRTAADLERRQAAVDDIAGAVAGTRVVPLQMARAEPTAGDGPRPPIALARRVGRETYRYAGPLYVATPEVLEYLHIDPRSIRAGADILSVQQGPLYYMDAKDAPVAAGNVQIIDAPRYSSAPRSLITTEALTRYGWTSAATAWLVEAPTTLTADQLTHARSIAADAGLTVESRRTQHALTDLRVGSTVVGFLLALGIVAMTVGLVRSEAATELRVLTASGASRRIRRAIAGVTAGTLAILGVFLGAAAAYAGLMAGYAEDLSALRPIPLPNLAAIAIGLPLVAATAAWLVAGKEPGSLARSPVE